MLLCHNFTERACVFPSFVFSIAVCIFNLVSNNNLSYIMKFYLAQIVVSKYLVFLAPIYELNN